MLNLKTMFMKKVIFLLFIAVSFTNCENANFELNKKEVNDFNSDAQTNSFLRTHTIQLGVSHQMDFPYVWQLDLIGSNGEGLSEDVTVDLNMWATHTTIEDELDRIGHESMEDGKPVWVVELGEDDFNSLENGSSELDFSFVTYELEPYPDKTLPAGELYAGPFDFNPPAAANDKTVIVGINSIEYDGNEIVNINDLHLYFKYNSVTNECTNFNWIKFQEVSNDDGGDDDGGGDDDPPEQVDPIKPIQIMPID